MKEWSHSRLGALFEEALAMPRESRKTFLDQACGGDAGLREELLSLLDAHDAASGYFEHLTEHIVAPALSALGTSGAPFPADNLTGKLQAALGDAYRVERELGGGGMSRVFLAEEVRLARKVVIKVLPEEMAASVNVERFRREIQLSARLQHPHIVPVLATDVADSILYYTMPFVAGETLRARIARDGPLPVKEAVGIWRDVLDALAYAHTNGVIHRDIKPENILLDGRNAVVADFGIALAVAAAADDVRATATGIAIGTPSYMAPEQAAGDRDADHRIDIYAAGLVMYEMLAGRAPFAGLSARAMLLAHLTQEPAPLTRPDMPPALATLVLECLAKDPAMRPASADAILDQLDLGLSQADTSAVTGAVTAAGSVNVRSRWRRWGLPIIAGSTLLVLAAALGISREVTRRESVLSQGTKAPPDFDLRSADRRPSLAVLPLEALTADSVSDYLADVLTAALIEKVTQAGDLRVIQGPSAFFFKGHRTRPRVIAESLGVSNVLSGAVHHEGPAVRVFLRLISGTDESVRWTHTYKGLRESLFALEDSIGGSIARELLPHLARPQTVHRRRAMPDPEAYELYRRGRYEQSRGADRSVNMQNAINYFSRAVMRDSMFAEAYAALAEAYGLVATGNVSDFPYRSAVDSARQFADRAIALDDSVPAAYEARAFVKMLFDFDWDGADADARRAIEISPYYNRRIFARAIMYQWRGDFAKAVAELRLDLASDPMSPATRGELARAHFFNKDNAAALAQLDTALSLEGGDQLSRLHMTLGEIYLNQRRFPEAIAEFKYVVEATPKAPTPLAFLAFAYAYSGNRVRAEALLKDLIARWRAGRSNAFYVAFAYAGLRDYDNAFAWLDSAYKDRSLRPLLMDPTFEELRRDRRFDALMRRIGLRR